MLSQRFRSCTGTPVLPKSLGACTAVPAVSCGNFAGFRRSGFSHGVLLHTQRCEMIAITAGTEHQAKSGSGLCSGLNYSGPSRSGRPAAHTYTQQKRTLASCIGTRATVYTRTTCVHRWHQGLAAASASNALPPQNLPHNARHQIPLAGSAPAGWQSHDPLPEP